MFIKLFKYDFLSVIKKIVFYYIVLVALSLFSLVCRLIFQNTRFEVVVYFPQAILYGTLYAALPVSIILCMIRYYKNMLSDEGYLTHTLPVKRSSILLSKLLNTLAIECITLVVMGICALIYFCDSLPSLGRNVLVLIQEIDPNFYGDAFGIVALTLLTIVFSGIFQVTYVSLCLTLGSMHNKNKLGMAFVYYIAINIALEIIAIFIAVVMVIGGTAYAEHLPETASLMPIFYICISIIDVFLILGIVVSYFVNWLCLHKRLNLN